MLFVKGCRTAKSNVYAPYMTTAAVLNQVLWNYMPTKTLSYVI